MGKIRVHELAKELGRSSSDLIQQLSGMGIDAKAQSGLEDDVVQKLRDVRPGKEGKHMENPAGEKPQEASDNIQQSAKKPAQNPVQRSQQRSQESAAQSGSGKEDAPKKKKFVAVFRRENARSSVISRMPTRPEQPQRPARPMPPTDAQGRPLRRRPVDANGNPLPIRRPAEGARAEGQRPDAARPDMMRPTGSKPEGTRPEPVKQEMNVPQTQTVPVQNKESVTPQAVKTGVPQAPKPEAPKQDLQKNETQNRPETKRAQEPEAKPAAPRRAPGTIIRRAADVQAATEAQIQKAQAARKAQQENRRPYQQDRTRPSGGQRPYGSSDRQNQQGQRGSQQAGRGSQQPGRPMQQGARGAQQSGRPMQQGQRGSQQPGRPMQQGARPQQGGRPIQDNAPVFTGKNPASQGRGVGKTAPSGRGKYDNQKNASQEQRQKNTRREGKDRNEKYNRFDANDRVQTGRRKKDPNRAGAFHKPEPVQVQQEQIKTITLPDSLTIKELADKMKMQASAIIKKLFMAGKMVTLNQEITYDEAEEIAVEYEILCEHEEKKDLIADLLKDEEENTQNMVPRPPVVCVMGHVDHGKTSLLDAIRNTHVTDRESGGITQHIGASVIHYNDRTITFLDTPGHEAFTAMRMRGANSTDIAVLVVAADDGVMPQTVEAINHAKAANIEIIVAINKIDKPSANIDRVKQELTEYELISEDWGGSTTMVPVSAKSHEGIDQLLEMILLTADVMELKADPKRRARGLVIEAKLDKGRGPVASLLVQKGTLHVGDPIDAGACYGKIRAMTDDKGRTVKEAGPSMPVEVIGFSDVPSAGEIFTSPETEKEAKNFAQTFITVGKEKMVEESKKRTSLDDLFSQIKEGTLKDLNLIVKADVQGSVEALRQSLLKLSNDEVIVKIIHSAVGAINESDVTLAGASDAIIIGFNVRPDAQAKSTAEHEGVEIKLYKVIYDAINDIENAMKGMLEPIYEEKVTGHVEIRQIFKASGIGNIAGSYVLDGTVKRGSRARITRDDKLIFEGSIASLKRFKDDVKEVRAGYECGLVFDGFSEIQEGDRVETYVMVEVPRT